MMGEGSESATASALPAMFGAVPGDIHRVLVLQFLGHKKVFVIVKYMFTCLWLT